MTFYTTIRLAEKHFLDPQTEVITVSEEVGKIGGTSAELY
jgi:hypothetical protein